MNTFLGIGRLTKDPDIRYFNGANGQTAVARYTLAIDRPRRKNAQQGDQTADFIPCVAYSGNAEFAEKYLHKGMKIAIEGRVQTGRYTNKEGQTVFTTDIIVNRQEFCESRNANGGQGAPAPQGVPVEQIPDSAFSYNGGGEDDPLPFK